jgi:aubergine-like protein
LYSLIKRICCVENPIPSQVVLAKTLSQEKKLKSIMCKIAMQINCKLGGALWTIKIPLVERIMFVGMDVYHDPKRKSSSVTGLVASMNRDQTKYFSRVSYQIPGQETVDSVRQMFREALIAFYTENQNAWPDRIIVFRDGVGDGQLEVTDKYEVVQMTETIAELCHNSPKFTFVVVQKRINARFFAHDGRSMMNPLPGTVVDHTVTRRHYYDFFLVSQLVRMGTVTPTHYIVLQDHGNTPPDLIQKFAYVTTFMYYNWAGSIRVPAVCQYAHKLAQLVGQYIRTDPSDVLQRSLYYL